MVGIGWWKPFLGIPRPCGKMRQGFSTDGLRGPFIETDHTGDGEDGAWFTNGSSLVSEVLVGGAFGTPIS